MKRMKMIFALTLALLLSGCGTAESAPTPTAEPVPTATPAPTPEPTAEPVPEPTAEPVEERPEREALLDEDGKEYGYVLYEYDEWGRCVAEALFYSDGSDGWRWEYSYSGESPQPERSRHLKSDGALSSITYYDEEGRVLARDVYGGVVGAERIGSRMEYDEWGNEIHSYSYDNGGAIVAENHYEYDELNREIKRQNIGSGGDMLETRSFYDEAGKLVRKESCRADGEPFALVLMDYDEEGRIIRERQYLLQPSVYSVREYEENGYYTVIIYDAESGGEINRVRCTPEGYNMVGP